jgi:phosphoglycerate dehydrogenase-like enzyme
MPVARKYRHCPQRVSGRENSSSQTEPICNNGGSNSVAVADHALLLMLAISRRLVW